MIISNLVYNLHLHFCLPCELLPLQNNGTFLLILGLHRFALENFWDLPQTVAIALQIKQTCCQSTFLVTF